MNTQLKGRLNQAKARQLQAEDGIAGLVYGYCEANSEKSHVAIVSAIHADAEKLTTAKAMKACNDTLICEGETYVRFFAIVARSGDVCENTRFGGSRARFALSSVEKLAKASGAKTRVVSRDEAQKWLNTEGSKLNSCETSRGTFHSAADGVRIALDDARAAGLTVVDTKATKATKAVKAVK